MNVVTINPKEIRRDPLSSMNSITKQNIQAGTFESTKLHQREFSVASSITRTLKENLTEDMTAICESYLTNKLTAQFKGLARFEDGKAGTRPIYLTKYGQELCGFDFNTMAPYKEVFKAKYFAKSGSRRGQIILHFPSFIPEKMLAFPDDATHFKISSRLIALSDFGYYPHEKSYRAVCKEFHGRSASFDSGKLPILKIPIDPITTQLCVDQKTIPDNTSLVLVMSVSFYRNNGGHYHHLNRESTMQIEQVF
jgi:hypothetical protein